HQGTRTRAGNRLDAVGTIRLIVLVTPLVQAEGGRAETGQAQRMIGVNLPEDVLPVGPNPEERVNDARTEAPDGEVVVGAVEGDRTAARILNQEGPARVTGLGQGEGVGAEDAGVKRPRFGQVGDDRAGRLKDEGVRATRAGLVQGERVTT